MVLASVQPWRSRSTVGFSRHFKAPGIWFWNVGKTKWNKMHLHLEEEEEDVFLTVLWEGSIKSAGENFIRDEDLPA